MNIDETRSFWKVASTFPADKEAVYPAHAAAHNFDGQARLISDGGVDRAPRVLEYGCGGGSDTLSLLHRGAAVTAVDVVPTNVETTRARILAANRLAGATELVRLLEHSAPLPFDSGYFDSVNCHGVLHHIPEATMHEVISEFYRVLKPGGMLYAMLYTEFLFKRCESQFNRSLPVDRAFSMMTDGGGIARAYTEAQGRAMFEDHNFTFIKAVEYNDRDFRTFWVQR